MHGGDTINYGNRTTCNPSLFSLKKCNSLLFNHVSQFIGQSCQSGSNQQILSKKTEKKRVNWVNRIWQSDFQPLFPTTI